MTDSLVPAPVVPPDPAVVTPPPTVVAPPSARRPIGLIVTTCVLSVAVLAVGALAGLKAAKIADLNTQVNKLQSDNAAQEKELSQANDATKALSNQLDAAISSGTATSAAEKACLDGVLKYTIEWNEAKYGAVAQSQVAVDLAAAQSACTPLGVTVHTPS